MADSVEILLDKPRHLRFDLPAVEDLERAYGDRPLGQLVTDINNLGVTALKLALWAGLKHEDKALTPTLIRKMMTTYLESGRPLSDLAEPLSRAIMASGMFGKSLEEPEGNEQTTTADQ
jgi:hypothetical protein